MEYINENTNLLVQGITGREGAKATREMVEMGIKISCGVTPGKGGQDLDSIPVFDNVSEAVKEFPEVNTSVVYVPPLMVYDAVLEAIGNNIKLIIIITENVPIKDTTKLIGYASEKDVTIIGPSSIGMLNIRFGKIGSISSDKDLNIYSKGNVGIISKSGGMCAETANILTREGIGQSQVIGIGGDQIIGTTYVDVLKKFNDDPNTKIIVMYCEIGGTYEEQAAQYIKESNYPKPIIAFVSGQFAEKLPRSIALGHTGAIIEKGRGKAIDKKNSLRDAGVIVVDFHYQIADKVKEIQNEIQD